MMKPVTVFTEAEVQQFVEEGFIRLDGAFLREIVDQGRALMWRNTGCDPDGNYSPIERAVRLGLELKTATESS